MKGENSRKEERGPAGQAPAIVGCEHHIDGIRQWAEERERELERAGRRVQRLDQLLKSSRADYLNIRAEHKSLQEEHQSQQSSLRLLQQENERLAEENRQLTERLSTLSADRDSWMAAGIEASKRRLHGRGKAARAVARNSMPDGVPVKSIFDGLKKRARLRGLGHAVALFDDLNQMLQGVPEWAKNVKAIEQFFEQEQRVMAKPAAGVSNVGNVGLLVNHVGTISTATTGTAATNGMEGPAL